MFLLVSLVVLVLSMMFPQVLTSSMQRQSNVFFLGTLIFRKGIDAILQKLGSTTCLLMLLSLKKLLSSHPLSKISTQYNRSYLSRPSAQ